MYKRFIVIVPIFVVLLVSESAVIAAARGRVTSLPALAVTPPEDYMPGKHLPDNIVCSWEYRDYPDNTFGYCFHGSFSGKWISVSYDRHTRIISQTSFNGPADLTVGDLVIAWGRPTGIEQDCCHTSVYWDSKSLYLMAHDFTPTTHLQFAFINYDLIGTRHSIWQGFVTPISN